MSPNDDEPTTEQVQSADSRAEDRGPTRRSVIQAGLVAGVAGPSLGGLGPSTAIAASSEDGPQAPENVHVEWHLGNPVGLTWDWPEDRCEADLAQFEVAIEDDEGRSESHAVPPQRRAVSVTTDARDTTVSVRAVDQEGRRSESVEVSLGEIAVEPPQNVLQPAAVPDLDVRKSTTVPIELESYVAEGPLVRYELEVSVRASCVARIGSVELPDELGLEFVDRERTTDQSAVRFVVEGEPVEDREESPLAHVQVVALEPGSTVLEVTGHELLALREERTYEEWEQYRESAAELPAEVGFDDLVREVDTTERWRAVSVEDRALPAPENFRIARWSNYSIDLTWDWAGDLCSEDLSHFEVTVRDVPALEPGYEYPREPLEERVVPAERPTVTVDTGQYRELLEREDRGEQLYVAVRAVPQDGTRSLPARESLTTGHGASPGKRLISTADSAAQPGETATVSVEFENPRLEPARLIRYELDVSVTGPCVASISDVTVPREEWEIAETESAEDDGAVTIVAEGPPPEEDDPFRQEVARIDVTGHSLGETVMNVTAVELLALDPDYYYEEYEYVRVAHERDDFEDPELTIEDMTQTVRAADTWSTLRVSPPPVVGDRAPRDVDGDGLYRDVTGDGAVTNSDVTTFFRNQHTSVVGDYPDAYDFTGDDEVGQADVKELFESL